MPEPSGAVRPEGTLAYRVILGFLRLLVRAFFRRVLVGGHEHIPQDRGGIVVSWHPNGLVDPGLVLTQFPRRVVFGARHGVFRWPLLGSLMRQIGTVPIYRAADLPNLTADARRGANEKSLSALAEEIARGSFSALFPEGISHDAPHLMELKTGAARLYYQARSMQPTDAPAAVIVPVGLHYDDKDLFRSNAMVEFFPALELPDSLAYRAGMDVESERAQARLLTDEIERVLCDVVLATESWPLHRLMHRARKLVRAERAHRAGADPGKVHIGERVLGFARIRRGYLSRVESHPGEVAALVERVNGYDADLQALALEDHELDKGPRLASPWLAALLLLQVLAVFFVLPPILIVGYLVNAPAALVLIAITRVASRYKKDEATLKLLIGALLFPMSWLGAGIAAASWSEALVTILPGIPSTPVLAATAVVILAAAGGAAALRYLRVARETARAVRVRLTRRLRAHAIERLLSERAALHDELIAMAEGLELPGEVLADGRVVKA